MRNREETVGKIEKILLTSIYTRSQNGIITNERISVNFASFCADRLFDNGIGDVVALQRENEKLRKRVERYERCEKAWYRGYQPTSSIETAPPKIPKNGSSAVSPQMVKSTISVKSLIEHKDDKGRLLGYLYFIPVDNDKENPQ